MDSAAQPDCSRARIVALHDWYRANVLDIPLVPELERRWLAFFRQGYNGRQLARVVRWLRAEIARGRRNPGSLKLSVLLDWSEDGSLLKFAEDHAAAAAAYSGRFATDRRLSAVPDGEGEESEEPRQPISRTPATPLPACGTETEAGKIAFENLLKLREKLK